VVVIGDLIVDELVEETAAGRRSVAYPGGAGCNVAIDLVTLGTPAILLAEVGDDPAGHELRRIIRDRGVDLRPLGEPRPTGRATSSRVAGEPTYTFTGSVRDRRFTVSPEIAAGLGRGRLLAVTTFPFGDAGQVGGLLALIADGGHRLMVDPNPRPQLLGDPAAFRAGFLRMAAEARIVKLSEQDHSVLDLGPIDRWCDELFASGVEAVILTRGAAGVRVGLPDGAWIEMPGPPGPPVVDAMGAGDAVFAVIAAAEADATSPRDTEWRDTATRAVDFASGIVAAPGGHAGARPLSQDMATPGPPNEHPPT